MSDVAPSAADGKPQSVRNLKLFSWQTHAIPTVEVFDYAIWQRFTCRLQYLHLMLGELCSIHKQEIILAAIIAARP